MQEHSQPQSCVQLFDIVFAIKKFRFCGAHFKCILAWERSISKSYLLEWNDPLLVIFHLPYSKYRGVRVWVHVFARVVIRIKIFHLFLTRVVRVALVLHSCHSRFTRVALVLHLCCTCVAFVLLVLHSCCSCLVLVL